MQSTVAQMLSEAMAELSHAMDLQALDKLRVAYLGRKGQLTKLLKQLGTLSPEERPVAGQWVNDAKSKLQSAIEIKAQELAQVALIAELADTKLDMTLPARGHDVGAIHPLMQSRARVLQFFMPLGFEVVEGPDVETEHYNFTALNVPDNHPARDEQDTFYLQNKHLLRTHTSSVQIRAMEEREPPVRLIAPGRAYRSDDLDATHTPMFHQVEGLFIDKSVTLAHLKTVLTDFLRYFFAKDIKLRFRTGFFPFTEPSAEVDMSCLACTGRGCGVCKQTGWIEILGCGMVHPHVLKAMHLSPEIWQGWAFGIGLERLAMFYYGIDDIRLFYEADVAFLQQFRGWSL